MNKTINKICFLAFIFSICACSNTSTSSASSSSNSSVLISSNSSSTTLYEPKNEVEEMFYELSKNNFTIDHYDSLFDFGNQLRNEKFYYTNYSLQAEGDFGFSGIAQGDELIFKYSIDEGQIVSGAPLINPNNGVRFESIFDYTYGMNNFNYKNLSFEKDNDGYYIYEFGKNVINDNIVKSVILRTNSNSLPPESLKFKIVKDVITFEATILTYDFDETDDVIDGVSTMESIIYDIGKTENPEIKKYLDDGKTSKDPLDLRFYKLFHPYLFTDNYSLDLSINNNYKFTEYCTKDAIYDKGENINIGYMMNQGVITEYEVIGNKVNILSTPRKDESTFYTSIYGDLLAYTFSNLDYNTLLGYKDESNNNIYYLTDSYLIYVLSYLCYNEIYEENYCDKVKLEIVNDETHEFKLYFEMYNKKTNRFLNTVEARFYDLNNTSIEAVEDYLSFGDNPNMQTKDNLNNVLNKFKSHNYSMDLNTGSGIAKYYYTENYMYAEVYGDSNLNFGFIKIDKDIYEFYIANNIVTVDKSINYASEKTLPGLGNYFGEYDDFGFTSMINEELYNINNYSIDNKYGYDYWKINNISLAYDIFNYYFASPKDIVPTAIGLICKDDNQNSKLTFYLAYSSIDGMFEGYSSATYYDIGTTSNQLIDDYLESLKGA